MLVRIKEFNGTVTELSDLSDTPNVHELKEQVELKLGIKQDVQRLIFSGKELTNNQIPLADYNIHEGTIVHLVVRNKPKPTVTTPAPLQPAIDQQTPMSDAQALGVDFDLEHQHQLMYADHAQDHVANLNVDAIFETVRMSRAIKLIALCELFEVLAFSVVTPALFPVAVLAICGLVAAETLRPYFLIPFVLLQLLNVVMMIVVFIPADVGATFFILNLMLSAWVTFLCVRFFRALKMLSTEDIAEARSLMRVHVSGVMA